MCVCAGLWENRRRKRIGQTAQREEADRELHGLGEEERIRKERGAEDQSEQGKEGKEEGEKKGDRPDPSSTRATRPAFSIIFRRFYTFFGQIEPNKHFQSSF